MKPRHYVVEMTPLDYACLQAGGMSALARKLGTSPQVIHLWKLRGRVAPAHVLEIEKLTGVSRYDLRPDLYQRPERKSA